MSRRDRPKKKSASPKRETPRATVDDARAASEHGAREKSAADPADQGKKSERVSESEERAARGGSERASRKRVGSKETSKHEPSIEHATHRDASTPTHVRVWQTGWLDDALVLIAAVLTFARSVPNDLVRGWDDGRFLVDFAPVQSISWDHLVAIFREPHFEAYHPLHLLSYWLDVPFAGAHGPTLHTTSLVLFAGALLLVRRVFRALGLGRSAALVATLAFGLHPVQVEAVAWATGRKEIVALLFASGAILLHLRSTSPFSGAAWGSRVLYVLAALAKTTVLPLPIVLVLIDVFLRPAADERDATSFWSRVGRASFAQLPTLAIGLALGMFVLSIWQSSEMVRPPLDGFGPVALVASTITHHLGHALAPFGSSPTYPIHRDASAFGALDYLGPLVLALALLVPFPRARFSILAFLALLLPVSNLVPLYFEVQDRYLALPLLPLAFGLGALVDAKHTSTSSSSKAAVPSSSAGRVLRLLPSARVTIALAYVALLATLTYRYSTAWANDGTLWRHATRAQPDADYAWLKLGETLRDEALAADPTRDDTRLTFDRSIHAYDRAIRIAPTLVIPHVARLRAMAHRDELVHGIEPSRAAELATRFGRAQANAEALKELASEMLELGYHDAALVPLARALDLDPIAPERLEHAARVQLEGGHEWLARFYVSRLPGPPIDPALAALR